MRKTEAILTLTAATGNERQWCMYWYSLWDPAEKQTGEMKICFLLILAGLTFLRDWNIVSPSVDTQVLPLPAMSHQILKCTPFRWVLVRMAHNCTFIRKESHGAWGHLLTFSPRGGNFKSCFECKYIQYDYRDNYYCLFSPPPIFPAWKGLHIFTRSCESKILFNIICLLLAAQL